MLARVVVVEPGARARVRDADGNQLGVLSDVREVWVDQVWVDQVRVSWVDRE